MKDGLAESRLSLPFGGYGLVADRSRFRDKGAQLKQLETQEKGGECLERQRGRFGGEARFSLPDKTPTAHEESALAIPGSYPLRSLLGNFHLFPGYVATAWPLSVTASGPPVAKGRSGAMRHAIITKDRAVTLVTGFCGFESIATGARSRSENGASIPVFLYSLDAS